MQEEIKKALEVLNNGGIILYPSDTAWGLGCDATNEISVKRLMEVKNQTATNSFILLVDNPSKIQSYVVEVPEVAWDLVEMSNNPLTIIYSEARNIASQLMGKDKSVGIRVTSETFSRNLCSRFRKPIVFIPVSSDSDSRNFKQIPMEIRAKVDYVVNYKQNETAQFKSSSGIKLGKGNIFQLI